MPTNHVIATWAYIFSALLDAFDGYAARFLNQGILSLKALKLVIFLFFEECKVSCLLNTFESHLRIVQQIINL